MEFVGNLERGCRSCRWRRQALIVSMVTIMGDAFPTVVAHNCAVSDYKVYHGKLSDFAKFV